MGVLGQGEVWDGTEQLSWCGFGRDGVRALMPSSFPHPWSCCLAVELQHFSLSCVFGSFCPAELVAQGSFNGL